MKKIGLILVIVFSFSLLCAEAPQWQWTKQAGSTLDDYDYSVSVDGNGNSYVCGYFQETVSFGTTTLISGGSYDVFIAKVDADGNWLWAIQAGGTNRTEAYKITTDVDGNSYITGRFVSSATFGTTTITTIGDYDIYVAKIDTDGNWLWAIGAGSTYADYSYGLCLDDNANLYITGHFVDSLAFGSTSLIGNGDYDVFVAKIDTDGNWLWASGAGGVNSDYSYDIDIDSSGIPYITGYYQYSATYGTTTITSAGGYDVYVAKIDTNGSWLWVTSGGGTGNDFCYNIGVGPNGNSYLTGRFQDTANFGASSITSNGSYDIYIAKIDTDGNWQWALGVGGTSYDYGYGSSCDTDGNVYVTGKFKETASFGDSTFTSNGSYDIFVAELDSDGNWTWVKHAGGSGNDFGRDVFGDSNGNSYLIGCFKDTMTIGDSTLTSNGGYDIFVSKLSTNSSSGVTSFAENFDEVTPPILPDGWTSCIDVLLSNTLADVHSSMHGTAPSPPNAIYIMNGLDQSCGQLDQTAFVSLVTPLVEVGDDGATLTFWATGNNPIIVGTMSDPADTTTFTPLQEFALNYIFSEYSLPITTRGSTYIAFKHGNTTSCQVLFVDNISFEQNSGLIGDFNDDGYVDAQDLQLFGDHWHFVDTDPGWNPMYDLDPDGIIDAADLQIFGDHWHEGTPPTLVKGETKGPNANAGIVFDLNSTTAGNQNLTHLDPQPAGTYIRVDVYATDVHNLDTYEFEVIYDANELDYISCSATNPLTYEGNILESEGGTAVGWMVDNDVPGILSIAYTLTGTDTLQAPEGEGLVADIVFQAKVTTHGTLSFGDVYYYDTFGVSDLITDTGTATLPVELSAFTAVYDADYTTLSWTTASETDILGFNIYRSTEDEFNTAKKLNAEMVAGHGTTTEMNTYEFMDIDQLNINTTYYYWLESVEFGGINTVYSSIDITPEEGTGGYINDFDSNSLSNFPNPIKGSTTILYSVKGMLVSQPVEINIYNMLGQLVDTVEGRDGEATWNTGDHATGIYFYKLNTDSYTEIKKMMVTK